MTHEVIAPCSKPQEMFLNNDDIDIIFYGGQAGGGKSLASLLHHLKWVHDPNYRGVTIRRTTPMLTKPGAIWDEAKKLYGKADPRCKIKHIAKEIHFPSGAQVLFTHYENANSSEHFQGAQLSSAVLDELTHFEEQQFWHVFSRLRSDAKMKPVIRATMNPSPDSWVRKYVDWYLFPKDHPLHGRPDMSKQGIVRWFTRDGNSLVWGSSREEVVELVPNSNPLSFMMIFASVRDNPYISPAYITGLMNMPRVEMEILLEGNWDARQEGTGYWKREWVDVVPQVPKDAVKRVRAWDISGTVESDSNPNPDYTAGVLMSKNKHGIYTVEDVVTCRARAGGVFDFILETAQRDGDDVTIIIPRDPNAAGKFYAQDLIRKLSECGYTAREERASKGKVQRFSPFAALSEAGGVRIVRADWNDRYMEELERFDGGRKGHDDMVDATSDAFKRLASDITIPEFTVPNFQVRRPRL